MKSIAFLSQKGGSGKTTLAVHTAVAAQEGGERVAVIDTDIQQSATTWGEARESGEPIVATSSAAELLTVLNAARHDAMTLSIPRHMPRQMLREFLLPPI
jgi:chromosome partitioning protein